ncbi:MAG: TrkH family potassium uptake protein [Coriobacteriia bacterium]|nr:TrkH family potassium uptake protein [Coriobacteriia bacterium]MDI6843150.1 potassium transporter TrkG [Anaerosomatales bacterium]
MLKPRLEDHLVIGKYTGKVIIGVGLLMAIPLLTSIAFAEWDTAIDFVIGMAACFIFGFGTQIVCRTDKDLEWSHGLVVASGSWVVATALGALPHFLSGHEGSYLDAMFDVMSGYTTTGLYLLQDLDHVSHGLNMWRHLLTYAGGQGIVVIALTFLFRGTAGAYKVYVGEGKDERLLPNVVQTARAIWLVSLAWLVVGTTALAVTGLALGQSPVRAILHGLWVFMGAWSTGGFAPQSYNTMYYHSVVYEVLSAIIFIAGSFNFALHWAVWTGKRAEIRKNIETVSFAITLTTLVLLATFVLARNGVYSDAVILARKVFYQVASGHTTTGFATIFSRAFVTQWGPVGMLATTIAMAIGASACSTGGGIKGIRVGIIAKAFYQDVRKMLSPESAVVRAKYHHVRDVVLEDPIVRTAMTIALAYVVLYLAVTVIGVLYGHPVVEAAFEGVSAASNTGLSCGVTLPSMPAALKIAYMIAMWLGRLEFMSVFALIGYGVSIMRGK